MKQDGNQGNFKNSSKSKIILLLSILVFTFWLLTRIINVYRFAVVGAIFESLWLSMLALLFILPILSWVFFWKESFNKRSLYLYSLLIIVATIIIIVFPK